MLKWCVDTKVFKLNWIFGGKNVSSKKGVMKRPEENPSLVDVYKRWPSTVDVDQTDLFIVDVDQTDLFMVDINGRPDWDFQLVDEWRQADGFITPSKKPLHISELSVTCKLNLEPDGRVGRAG